MTEVLKTVAGIDCLAESKLDIPKQTGKVRDCYDLGAELLMVATDRLSAFDRLLSLIPYKGQVLNQISAWWFEHTQHIVDNHFIKLASANAMLVKKYETIPVEVVMRAYLTGSTNTAIHTLYTQGQRNFFGVTLKDGLKKNHTLDHAIITPTTKQADHDRPLDQQDILSEAKITEQEWEFIKQKSFELFQFASDYCQQHDLILVDTKYEFGKASDGSIILIDELHTPDSSRYWLKQSYQQRIDNNLEPENYDKEFIRLWFREHCDPYSDETLPQAPDKLILELSERYLQLYTKITGQTLNKETPTCAELSALVAKQK